MQQSNNSFPLYMGDEHRLSILSRIDRMLLSFANREARLRQTYEHNPTKENRAELAAHIKAGRSFFSDWLKPIQGVRS